MKFVNHFNWSWLYNLEHHSTGLSLCPGLVYEYVLGSVGAADNQEKILIMKIQINIQTMSKMLSKTFAVSGQFPPTEDLYCQLYLSCEVIGGILAGFYLFKAVLMPHHAVAS